MTDVGVKDTAHCFPLSFNQWLAFAIGSGRVLRPAVLHQALPHGQGPNGVPAFGLGGKGGFLWVSRSPKKKKDTSKTSPSPQFEPRENGGFLVTAHISGSLLLRFGCFFFIGVPSESPTKKGHPEVWEGPP